MPEKTKPATETGRPPIAGEPQEHDTPPRQQKAHGVQTTQAAVGPPLADDGKKGDTIPEMQARVLAVMDLSQAFGLGFYEFKEAIICAVLEDHTETDANCWCGKLHPKKRKEEVADGR